MSISSQGALLRSTFTNTTAFVADTTLHMRREVPYPTRSRYTSVFTFTQPMFDFETTFAKIDEESVAVSDASQVRRPGSNRCDPLRPNFISVTAKMGRDNAKSYL